MDDLIDIDAYLASFSLEELRDDYREALIAITALTQAIKAQHPLIMGKGDGAIATAIKLITECRCR